MTGTLHILTGKIASGKSTLAETLSERPNTIRLSEDRLLASIYKGDMNSIADYMRNSTRLREGLLQHIIEILSADMSVVLDFAANTVDQRLWMLRIIEGAGCGHILHFLDVPDEVCRARMHARNASGTHPFIVTDVQFDRITEYFIPPQASENFTIMVYPTES